jgi:hypothetical protein
MSSCVRITLNLGRQAWYIVFKKRLFTRNGSVRLGHTTQHDAAMRGSNHTLIPQAHMIVEKSKQRWGEVKMYVLLRC